MTVQLYTYIFLNCVADMLVDQMSNWNFPHTHTHRLGQSTLHVGHEQCQQVHYGCWMSLTSCGCQMPIMSTMLTRAVINQRWWDGNGSGCGGDTDDDVNTYNNLSVNDDTLFCLSNRKCTHCLASSSLYSSVFSCATHTIRHTHQPLMHYTD